MRSVVGQSRLIFPLSFRLLFHLDSVPCKLVSWICCTFILSPRWCEHFSIRFMPSRLQAGSYWKLTSVDIYLFHPCLLSQISSPISNFFVRFQDLARSNLPDEVRISLADEVLGPPKPHQLRTVNDISKIHIFQPFLHIDRDLIIWSYFHIFPPFNVITSCFNMFPPLVSCILMHFVLLEGRTAFFSPKKTQGSQGFFWCWFGRRLMEAQALSQDHGSTATHGLNFHIFSRLYWGLLKKPQLSSKSCLQPIIPYFNSGTLFFFPIVQIILWYVQHISTITTTSRA